MKQGMIKMTVASVSTLVLTGCGLFQGNADLEEYATASAHLTFAADSVHSYVQYMSPAPDLTGSALIEKAKAANNKPFLNLEKYHIEARREGPYSSLLLCDADKSKAIAEDSGCTSGELDANYWESRQKQNCEFALDLKSVCAN